MKSMSVGRIAAIIVYLALGLILIINPEFLDYLCRVLGVVFIIAGVVSAVAAFIGKNENRNRLLGSGIFLVIFGVIFEILPQFLAFLIPVAIGAIFIINGALDIIRLFSGEYEYKNKIIPSILSVILIILGIVIIIEHSYFFTTVEWVIGLFFIIAAVFDFVDLLLAKKGGNI